MLDTFLEPMALVVFLSPVPGDTSDDVDVVVVVAVAIVASPADAVANPRGHSPLGSDASKTRLSL